MGKRAKYTAAELLWNSVAICDQEQEVMAIQDENGLLRIAVRAIPGGVEVLLIGDDEDKVLYNIGGIDIGTVKTNMEASFRLYQELSCFYSPSFVGCDQNKKVVKAYELLTHTRIGAIRHGNFHKIDGDEEVKSRIAKAIMELDKYSRHRISDDEEDEDWEEDVDWDAYWDPYWGSYDWEEAVDWDHRGMTYLGDGVWCDDDGDNWDFC